MSRLTRSWEHLKTGFQAEAASAARLKTLARKAERESKPRLARALERLGEEKVEVAGQLLKALDRDQNWLEALEALAAEERYELEVLYPKLLADLGSEARELIEGVQARHRDHLALLEKWFGQLLESRDDLPENP